MNVYPAARSLSRHGGANPILAAALAISLHPGIARWPVKVSAHIAPAQSMTLASLMALGNVPGVARNDRRYRRKLIPGREGAIVTTSGWLRLVAQESDGDYHVQLTNARGDSRCLIVEVPLPAFVPDAALAARCATARAEVHRLAGADPLPTGTPVTPVRVAVTGQLFYDDAHVGGPPRGKGGMKAATLWELHPVFDVQPVSSTPPVALARPHGGRSHID
jgi:hypothetical protein